MLQAGIRMIPSTWIWGHGRSWASLMERTHHLSVFIRMCVPSRDRCGWAPVALCGWVFLVTRLVSAGLRRRDFKLTLRKEVVMGKGFLLLLLLLFQPGAHTYIHLSQEQWSRAGRVLENSSPGEQKEGLTGKHPWIVRNWGADWDQVCGGIADLIAQSQGYSDSGEFETLLHLNVKKQRQLSLLPVLQMPVDYQSKSCLL